MDKFQEFGPKWGIKNTSPMLVWKRVMEGCTYPSKILRGDPYLAPKRLLRASLLVL